LAYKHDYDKILTRLTVILSRLNDGEALSVTELSKEFGTSERTIQRDFNERLISFPIYQENKKWKMQDGFKIEKSNSMEDAIVLNILESMVGNNNSIFSKRAKRLLSKIKNQEYNPIYVKLDMEDISDKLLEIQQLESAIKNRVTISCTYSFETFTKEVTINPLKIANYDGFWYLIALDARDAVLKKYYLKNITSIQTTDNTFTTDTKLEELLDKAISIWFNREEPFSVRLQVGAEIAKYFKRKPISNTQKILSLSEEGSMEIEVKITHEMEIIPIVKYWMPYIQVLEPIFIKEMIESDVKSYIELSTLS